MTGQELLDRMDLIDETYILEADAPICRRNSVWKRVAAVAACVALMAATVWQGGRWYTEYAAMLDGGMAVLPTSGAYATSDEHAALTDLLEDLSENEDHELCRGDGYGGMVSSSNGDKALDQGRQAVVIGRYAYYIGDDAVMIADLSVDVPYIVNQIEEHVSHLFYTPSGMLVTVKQESLSLLSDETPRTVITGYDVSDPMHPIMRHRWEQYGELTDVYLAGEDLVVITSDGVCACGWSRLSDTSAYRPHLLVDGEEIAWSDEEICILGSPSVVQYVAVTRLSIASASVRDKCAFYGNQSDMFYGKDWLAFVVGVGVERVYTFSMAETITYTGLFDIPDKEFWVYSINKHKSVYRVMGSYRTGRGGNMTEQAFAMTVDMKYGDIRYTLCELPEKATMIFATCFWERNRAVMTIDRKTDPWSNMLILAEFCGRKVDLYISDVEMDDLSAQYKGCEWIPLENGIYARYNRWNSVRDGLNIYDLSNSKKTACLYDSDGELTNARFGEVWQMYDEHTLGILVQNMDESGRYHNGSYEWHIYRVDIRQNKPFTRLNSYEVWNEQGLMNIQRFATFEYNGQWYITSQSISVPMAISW